MSCKEDECYGFYRFYHKFKQYKFFIGHNVMAQTETVIPQSSQTAPAAGACHISMVYQLVNFLTAPQ